ncbi:uncharacterized protein EI97DRAFT_464670 [Westerdykella ornata]|uniref:Telomere replication protein EST3 n=1 Tax=Westerdykella ornata TaxID=318751 RepID=A0A6A6JWE6_WESOR|nr:uncharacterized protein EI97DRAFT_464670 [Westerdykella ornata]KAF2279389.1 hypothetical protein EI97DRAFT_464670 [Westerdykella ornata]
MEKARKGWLEDSICGDLLLGVHWLQERIQSRIDGVKQEPDQTWSAVYQDDGSCLTIDPAPTSQERRVRIIEASPLTLSDGHTSIRAIFAPACIPKLPAWSNDLQLTDRRVGSTLSLRNYAVRCTSYGPPADKLHLVLHAVDWHRGRHVRTVGTPDPVTSLAPFKALLARLTDVRVQGHRKYVYEDRDSSVMSSSSLEDSQSSQKFATQMPPVSVRGRQGNAGVQQRAQSITDTGRQQSEPALRRSGQPARPGRPDPGLLSLLDNHARHGNPQRAQSLAQTPLQPQNHSLDETSSPPMQQVDVRTSEGRRVESASNPDVTRNPTSSQAKPEWLAGWVFDVTAATVADEQKDCLLRPEAWHKPPPGVQSSVINIPIEIQKQIEDHFNRRQPPAEHDCDSSYDPGISVAEDGQIHGQPSVSVDREDQIQSQLSHISLDERETTWSPSPPRSPKQTHRPSEALPPDSTLGSTVDATPKKDVRPDLPLNPPSASIAGKTPSGSTGPSLSNGSANGAGSSPLGNNVASPQSPFSLVRPRNNVSRPNAVPPGSSLLGRPLRSDPDDEEDMEVSVPLALGEDLAEENAGFPIVLPNRAVQSKPYHRPQPIAHVQETLEARQPGSAPALGAELHPSLPQGFNGASEHTSNVRSIARTVRSRKGASQYLESYLLRSDLEELLEQYGLPITYHDGKPMIMKDMVRSLAGKIPLQPGRGPSVVRRGAMSAILLSDSDEEMEDVQVQVERSSPAASLPEGTNLATGATGGGQQRHDGARQPSGGVQDPPRPELTAPRPDDFPVKRKSDSSPSRLDARRPKRREISVKNFGSSPSRPRPRAEPGHSELGRIVQVPATQVLSPNPAPKAANTGLKATENAASNLAPEVVSSAPPSITGHTGTHQVQAISKAPLPLPEDRLGFDSSRDTRASFALRCRLEDDLPGSTTTVFAKFKLAYPDYTGNKKHFINQCNDIYQLDLEDKMVGTYLWDDYLIRNRTDYKDYVNKAMDEGERYEPYLRFFKQSVRVPRYTKEILSSPNMVYQALLELGEDPEQRFTGPRSSLSRNISVARGAFQPRPSYPSLPQFDGATDEVSEPSVKRRRLGEQGAFGRSSSDPPEEHMPPMVRLSSVPGKSGSGDSERISTGNAFGDCILGEQKMTSITGSVQEDITLKWPASVANRPSLPKRPELDVLAWKDYL